MLREHIDTISTGWKQVLLRFIEDHPDKWSEIESNYETELETYKDALEIFPEIENVFRCFNYFEPSDTKVIILGQDPYHGPDQATGLCFGVKQGVVPPPSLRNIMKKLPEPLTDTSLENWAKQGVLLLNASLTVRQGCPSSHMKPWKLFTKFIIDWTVSELRSIIYLAWGAFAHTSMESCTDDASKGHHLLVSSHPSPLSASRSYRSFPSFMASEPFIQINNLLEKDGATPIQWN